MRKLAMLSVLPMVLVIGACSHLATSGAGAPPGPVTAGAPYDLVISNGRIVDGTGAPD